MWALYSFYHINQANYEKQREIQNEIVNHPENLPQTELAELTSIWFRNLRANLYWLRAVQYIGSNAIESEYKKYLFEVLSLITDLNPYFEKPYIIGQLLLPAYNQRYESLSTSDQLLHINQSIKLWLKWVRNFCDIDKVNAIKSENDIALVWQNEAYKNPCKSYGPAYYLAYIYHFYKNDSLKASEYYKVAAANDDSPEWAKTLAAIMQWKWGNREKSTRMFLSLAKQVEISDTVCSEFAVELEKVYKWIIESNTPLDWDFVQAVENTRNQIFWVFSEEREEELFWNTKCANFVNKAIREVNLSYVEAGNQKYRDQNPWKNMRNALGLFEEWFIDFLPTDLQQYWDFGIIYEYNPEKDWYDYTMWTYN